MEILSSIFDYEYDYRYYNSIYAEERQLEEALAASLYISSPPTNHHNATSSSSNHHQATSSSRNNQATSSSSSRTTSCEICTEDRRKSDMHKTEGCNHSFCYDCISKHIQYKLQHNIVPVTCPYPDCPNIIQPIPNNNNNNKNNNASSSLIRSKIPQEVFDRWEKATIESIILASSDEIIHCPYEKCSEILVIENGVNVITETECPRCHKLFCAKCRVSWHYGFSCRDFQRLNRNDRDKRKLRLLAKENKWKKCPNCRVFVDKTEGCVHITCRCKFEFCYVCGKRWKESHWNTCKE